MEGSRSGQAPSMDTTGGRWRFVWWVTIPLTSDVREFDTLSDVLMPLVEIERNTELECSLKAIAPAHTLLIVGYARFVEFALPAHTAPLTGAIHWENLADGLGDISTFRAADGDAVLTMLQLRGTGDDTSSMATMEVKEEADGSTRSR